MAGRRRVAYETTKFMLTTVHGAIGILIGEHVASPLWSFVIGFIGHFILDVIPHGDHHQVEHYLENRKIKKVLNMVIIDSILGISLLVLYISQIWDTEVNFTSIAAGIIGSILPDLLVAVYSLNKRYFFRLNFFHHRIHQLIPYDLPAGLAFALQICVIVVLWQFYGG
jgi:hypothetical protein